MLGTAEEPIFCQPAFVMERYIEAFEKLVGAIETVLTADYTAVEPWPPRQPPVASR